MSDDETHLKLLSIFHYVVGGIMGFFALIPIIHVVFGLLFVFSPDLFEPKGQSPPAIFGWIIAIVGMVAIAVGWTFAGCILATGRFLARRKHYWFCVVIAGIECLMMPFGTALGVFTIIVLMKDSVKARFFPPASESSAAISG